MCVKAYVFCYSKQQKIFENQKSDFFVWFYRSVWLSEIHKVRETQKKHVFVSKPGHFSMPNFIKTSEFDNVHFMKTPAFCVWNHYPSRNRKRPKMNDFGTKNVPTFYLGTFLCRISLKLANLEMCISRKHMRFAYEIITQADTEKNPKWMILELKTSPLFTWELVYAEFH